MAHGLSFAAACPRQTHYKLYCICTPEFQTLYEEYFLPSFKDDFEIVMKECPQECSSGRFRSDGWEKTMLRKLELLIQAIEENWNDQVFFYSDIDIIFLRPILQTALNHLEDNDFVVQQSWPRNALCAGFFVMKGNEKTLKLITTAHHLLQERICIDDQLAIRAALKECATEELAWKFLPSEQFPNGRRVLTQSKGNYSDDSEIVLDDSIVLFHASCCVGLDNKYRFLTRVQNEFLKRQSIDD
jgi:hypothetical protein